VMGCCVHGNEPSVSIKGAAYRLVNISTQTLSIELLWENKGVLNRSRKAYFPQTLVAQIMHC
jgi:hypothetical protein